MVQNLAQLKREVAAKRPFVILEHWRKEHIGEIRIPNVIQTNAFYSVEKDKPNSKVTLANDGKGYYCKYEKAGCYEFYGEEISVFINEKKEELIFKFKFL